MCSRVKHTASVCFRESATKLYNEQPLRARVPRLGQAARPQDKCPYEKKWALAACTHHVRTLFALHRNDRCLPARLSTAQPKTVTSESSTLSWTLARSRFWSTWCELSHFECRDGPGLVSGCAHLAGAQNSGGCSGHNFQSRNLRQLSLRDAETSRAHRTGRLPCTQPA